MLHMLSFSAVSPHLSYSHPQYWRMWMSFKIIYLSVLPFEVQTAVVNTSDADIPFYQTGLFAILKLQCILKYTTPWGSMGKTELLKPRNLSYHTLPIITDTLLGAQPFHFTAFLSWGVKIPSNPFPLSLPCLTCLQPVFIGWPFGHRSYITACRILFLQQLAVPAFSC